MCTWMESSPFRVIPLVSISSPCRGTYFQVQGAHEETTRHKGRLEESRNVALVL